MQPSVRGLNVLQKISMSLMGVLVILTFVGTNLQAVFWQSSDWLVSTVLPAVVVQLTNQERADNEAGPLQRNSVLDVAATLKAEDMAKNEYFSHFSPTDVSPWHWFDQAGYVYAHAGENLAIHFTDSSEVVEAWMKSPLHRKNIINGVYTEIGVGTAKGKFEGYDTVYVVQLFGTPAVAPVQVDPAPKLEPVAVAAAEPVVVSEEKVLPVSDVPLALAEVLSSESVISEPVSVAASEPETGISTNKPDALLATQEPVTPEQLPEESLIPIEPVNMLPAMKDVIVIESPIISTSSGLAIANITTQNDSHAGATVASIATRPNALLQIIYITLGAIVLLLLSISIVTEARRLHFVQVAYGVMLILGMGGLWFVNSLLTSGAVIV
jgi:uncharacterized protein YkwD